MPTKVILDVDTGADESVTATWEEARPPHLPDRITAIPVMVWPFVVLTALVVYDRISLYRGQPFDASIVVSLSLGIARLAAMILLGAALFLRHPDAWSRLRPVAIAVTLIAMGEALDVFAPHIDSLVQGEWDGSDLPIITASYVLGRAASVIGILGVASLWFGLRANRRATDRTRTLALFVALSVGALAFLALGYDRILDDAWVDPDLEIAAAATRIGAAIHATSIVAWMAVASVLLVGARGRERPTAGWRIGAIAILAIVLGLEPVWVLWPTYDMSTSGLTIAGWIVVGTAAAGAVLLLVAFLLGLPDPADAEPV